MNVADGKRPTLRTLGDRALKCGISLLVFLFLEMRKTLARAFGRAPKPRCVVVYYHSVPPAERQKFAKQLDWMLRWARPIRIDSGAEPALGKDCVAITFDDGFENFLTQALPELEKRKIPAALFVIAEAVSREFGWENNAERMLSPEQVRGLPPDLVIIGSHTLTHPMLTELGENEARREIQESRTKLEAMLRREVKQFSFPFGGFNQRLVELCRDAGYERVYTTLPAFAFEERDEFMVGRVRVDPTDWRLELRLKLAGAYIWMPIAISLKRQIVSFARRSMTRPAVRTPAPRPMVR